MSAYCETCAAIGNVYVNYRLFLLHGESKYYDVLERTLYNGLISGVSMDGGGFFYPNPLESMGQHQRQAWFGCACCPSNICRFLPSLPGYVYAVKDRNVYVNLFLSNSSQLSVAGKKVSLSQFTEGKMAYDAFISKDYKNVLTLYKGQNLETLTENVQSLAFDKSGKLTTKDETLKLIPYFAWAHRGNGNMKVWLPQDVKAARPSAPATLASQAKVEFSSPVPAKSSITDGLVPADENDRSIPYCHWWPKKNTTEWITYTFPEAKEIKTSTVYWYDDQPWGGCKVPDSWKIYYQDEAGNWKEVTGADGYPTNRGVASTVNFDPVKTKAVKLELKQPETHSCGLFEWSVK